MVVISWELLHEVDSEYPKNSEKNDAHGIVEIVDAVDVLLHQNHTSLILLMLLLVCLVKHLTLYFEFL